MTAAFPVIRLAHGMAFGSFLRQVGAPVDSHLRKQGLPVLCCDPDAFVPLPRLWSYFDAAARHETPDLGWLVAGYVGEGKLNSSLLRQLHAAPSLLQALRRLMQMASAEASHIRLGIHERRDAVLVSTQYLDFKKLLGYDVAQAYQLGLILSLIRHYLGRHWTPDEVGIECRRNSVAARELCPGTRILTQQSMGYIAVPRTCLLRASYHDDQRGGAADNLVLTKDFDFIDTLRVVLKSYLSEGYLSARFAAALVGTSTRTLYRNLSVRGLTYGMLVDEVRFTAARNLLQKPGAQIRDVARSVGFDDQSHFARMFRRVGGVSPREFRSAIRT